MSGENPTPEQNETRPTDPATVTPEGVPAPAPSMSTTSEPTDAATEPATAAPDAKAVPLPDFNPTDVSRGSNGIELLGEVELNVKIELGRASMLIEDVLQLGEGSVVELDKLAGDPVDVLVNDRLVARGEVLVLNDNFCVRISEIISDGSEAEAA